MCNLMYLWLSTQFVTWCICVFSGVSQPTPLAHRKYTPWRVGVVVGSLNVAFCTGWPKLSFGLFLTGCLLFSLTVSCKYDFCVLLTLKIGLLSLRHVDLFWPQTGLGNLGCCDCEWNLSLPPSPLPPTPQFPLAFWALEHHPGEFPLKLTQNHF